MMETVLLWTRFYAEVFHNRLPTGLLQIPPCQLKPECCPQLVVMGGIVSPLIISNALVREGWLTLRLNQPWDKLLDWDSYSDRWPDYNGYALWIDCSPRTKPYPEKMADAKFPTVLELLVFHLFHLWGKSSFHMDTLHETLARGTTMKMGDNRLYCPVVRACGKEVVIGNHLFCAHTWRPRAKVPVDRLVVV